MMLENAVLGGWLCAWVKWEREVRERDTRREREKKKEGGREGGEAGVRREGKARQGKDFLGEKSSLWQKDLKKS